MTALDARVRATGLVAYKALIDHAVENGLPAPTTIVLTNNAIEAWIPQHAATRWLASIHVDTETARPSSLEGREIVTVAGRLPLLGIKVLVKFSRPVMHLKAVTA